MFFYSTDSRCIENVNPVEVRCFYQTLAPEWLHPDEVSQENICLGTLFLALLRESGLEATKATNPEQVLVFLGIDLKCRHFQKKKKKTTVYMPPFYLVYISVACRFWCCINVADVTSKQSLTACLFCQQIVCSGHFAPDPLWSEV